MQPGPGGISAQGRYKGIKLAVTPEYSKHTGVSLGVALASMLGDNAAVGILVRGGDDKKEILLNAGFNLGNSQQLILSAGQLKQSLDFSFPSGTERVDMAQDSAGIGYQLQLGQEFLRYLEVNGYVSRTASRDLADKTFFVDTATLYELWNDPRRVAGGRISGLQGRLGFTPLQGSLVKVSLGYEHLRYDLLAGNDSMQRPTAGLEWQQQLGQGYRLLLGAERFASQDRYTAGVERSLSDANGRHSIGLNLIGVQGRAGIGNDQQVQLAYSYSFGRSPAGSMPQPGQRPPMRSMAGEAPAGQPQLGGNLLDRVATRPGYMPSRVVAKVDTTAAPTRLVAVDKTGLPGGTRIDTKTGDVTVPLGVAVTGFAGITRNLAAFANTGQFALGGSTLTIRPGQMVQPVAGSTDSYVLTLNNAGGGTTSVTVAVSKGSVRIDSIVIASGDTTAPTTTAAPSVSGTTATGTTLSATINENGTGYYLVQPAAVAAPSVAAVQAGTSFAMTANVAASVSIAGLAAATDYVIYFVAKDSANNAQTAVQSVTVTTIAAPAAPTAASVSIAGTALVGQVLTGSYSYVDANGDAEGTSSFRWLRDGVAISGATGLTYLLVAADQGKAIRFEVTPVSTVAPTTGTPVVSSATSLVAAAPDTTAPTTTAAPSVSGTSYNNTTLSATINETGTGYYLVQPAAAAAPTVAAVQAGSSFAMTENVAASVNISGLTAATDYVIYFVAKDAANNVQAAVQSVAFTTTAVADTTPDAFSFTDLSDQALSTQVESNTITVAGINAATAITISGGEYQINGGSWTSAAGTVTNGQTVKLRHTTSASNGTTTDTTLTIGGVSDTFTSTTVAGLPTGYIQQGGLTWMPNNIGPWSMYGYQGVTDWNTANTYCNTATINGQTGWRLPTVDELSSLYNSGALAGQGWTLNGTWSSTPDGAGTHYYVFLYLGGVYWNDDAINDFVTCVR